MKKAQAAMEFLMTYGWAILVVLAAIAALAYFGVFNMGNVLPDKCTLEAGFSCTDFKVTTANTELYLINNLGFDVNAVTVGLEGCGAPVAVAGTWINGNAKTVTVPCVSAGGSKVDKSLNISYTNTQSSVSHKATGKIQAKVE